MEYYGPNDYYFWQGISRSKTMSIIEFQKWIETAYYGNNVNTKEIAIYCEWGFYLGLELTKEEINQLGE